MVILLYESKNVFYKKHIQKAINDKETFKETYGKKTTCSIPCINNYMETLQWFLCGQIVQ